LGRPRRGKPIKTFAIRCRRSTPFFSGGIACPSAEDGPQREGNAAG
jgi:hypothetical protein